ncbi:hypothetical protein ACHBTE_18835 [Streptomyces sp. M41]|uniref:hypothetical protein n=1 Tax=Streptomyces sp. M41 TaxID=3059412 RepID=UPI00374D84D1
MIGRHKIATVSGFIGALALVYGGAVQAHAEEDKVACTMSAQGDIVCIKKDESIRKDKRGYVVKQRHDCQTVERPRVTFPEGSLLNDGSTDSGPEVDCSNRAKLPKGYKLPKFKF